MVSSLRAEDNVKKKTLLLITEYRNQPKSLNKKQVTLLGNSRSF